jgi:hypothetical protein
MTREDLCIITTPVIANAVTGVGSLGGAKRKIEYKRRKHIPVNITGPDVFIGPQDRQNIVYL